MGKENIPGRKYNQIFLDMKIIILGLDGITSYSTVNFCNDFMLHCQCLPKVRAPGIRATTLRIAC